MLFGYPVAVTAENWLHDCLIVAVKRVHELVTAGKRMPSWPRLFPEAYRDRLSGRKGLEKRLKAYTTAIKTLNAAERQSVLEAVEAQNKISDLLIRRCDCEELANLPERIREPAKDLFTFAFGLLTDYEIRQRQYLALCNSIPARVCPFCGCEGLDAPGAPQEDLDHYIPRSKYPFAAANLRNLAPMGGRCNASYKHIQDPLRANDGRRRAACDPYHTAGVGISLSNSVVDEMTPGPIVSDWVIEFLPTNEAIETWDEIFHIKERWTRDVLDERTFNQWLGDFRNYCFTATLQITGDGDVLRAVSRYEEYLTGCGFSDRAFLKAAVFRFLLRRCSVGCQRLLPMLRDLTGAPQPRILIGF
ncbi:hypothetical protein [Pseudomonas petrae]|uniref:hypothetical protein n=1 Tax=Pseudomonas petrae TaxID=2912190 RepID=UPI001F1993B5|nr:hypothetical protein [Pseudomonas petrae]MCF7538032.1 hypothetical protein [Pseudomonas petrae]